jgi:hypothetical protein
MAASLQPAEEKPRNTLTGLVGPQAIELLAEHVRLEEAQIDFRVRSPATFRLACAATPFLLNEARRCRDRSTKRLPGQDHRRIAKRVAREDAAARLDTETSEWLPAFTAWPLRLDIFP